MLGLKAVVVQVRLCAGSSPWFSLSLARSRARTLSPLASLPPASLASPLSPLLSPLSSLTSPLFMSHTFVDNGLWLSGAPPATAPIYRGLHLEEQTSSDQMQ